MLGVLILIVAGYRYIQDNGGDGLGSKNTTKLYWFIPDGMRADPELFDIYRWAEEGKLPNIKRIMEEGSYGYSVPDFPSHTPTNFATLFTGAHADTHGIADGPMHVEGFPLEKPSAKGFTSTAKKVAPIWNILEDEDKEVVLLSIPGSTPPELKDGITIRGRWGGWGADVHSVIFEPKNLLPLRKTIGRGTKLFYLGPHLTDFVDTVTPSDWENVPTSFSPPKEALLEAHGVTIFSFIYDTTNDSKENYDAVAFSFDKKNIFYSEGQGVWSDWNEVTLAFNEAEYTSNIKIKAIKLWDNGDFRIKVLFDTLNRFIVEPNIIADELYKGVGPMVDFPDNWPPQLIYEPEDKQTFIEEADMALTWHKDAAAFILDTYDPDVFIQDTYTANQMLESRWWHGIIEPQSNRYDKAEAESAMGDIQAMYQGLDAILGEMLNSADEDTIVALSSDHGVCHLNTLVKLNNLFADKGWLQFIIDPVTGEAKIDWEKTKVVYLKMANIYIDPDGLSGNWNRAEGVEYEALREEVINTLRSLTDDHGVSPVKNILPWEEASGYYNLPEDRIGDITLEAELGYFWTEEMDESLATFVEPITSGYKQTIDPTQNCMKTPFMIMGPGVKRGNYIEEPIQHIDQLPTILRLLDVKVPTYSVGSVLKQIFDESLIGGITYLP